MSLNISNNEPIDSNRVQQLRNASKKCYAKKIRENPEFYAAEKERIKEYKNNRYKTDPVFAEKVKSINRENQRRKKEASLNQTN
jgi:hypothetical protein